MSADIETPQTWDRAALELLLAHCASLDPDTATARQRLDATLGPELARKLVFALSAGAPREQPASDLGARFVFAA